MKKIFNIIIASLLSLSSIAQGEFKFEEESFNFGNITEGDQAAHTFKFKNIGNEPIIISRVKASCGCTTPSWTNTPIAPGESGYIRAKYNSKGRPGGFHKSITVTSNAKSSVKVLKINGNTEKAPEKAPTPEEIAKSPHLKIINNEHNFGTIQANKNVSKKFEITNTGQSDLIIRNTNSPCNCVTYSLNNSPLKPGENGILTIFYKPRTSGVQNELISIYTNDYTKKSQKIFIKAIVSNNVSNKSIIDNDSKITF